MSLPSSIDPSFVARITRSQYDAMVASGALEGAKVELLEGVIVDISPQGTDHAGAIQVLADLLRTALGQRAWVREEKPFVAGPDDEPEPDIAVVPRADPFAGHPDRAFLVVEVADSSLKKDRGVKTTTYARAGVPEYWVVNLVDGVVEVHRDPGANHYATTTLLRPGDHVAMAAFADVSIEVARFLKR